MKPATECSELRDTLGGIMSEIASLSSVVSAERFLHFDPPSQDTEL
jgi:hypothetical protein